MDCPRDQMKDLTPVSAHESSRPPRVPSPPLITIQITPEDEATLEVPHVISDQTLYNGNHRLEGDSVSSPPNFALPNLQPSNVLQIPGSSSHRRSSSVSSNASNTSQWSGWSPSSPVPGRATSDFGDIDIDTRELLKSMEEGTKEELADNPFAFSKKQLGKSLYDPKNLNLLRAMMGAAGLAMGLRVDLHQGLSPDEDKLDGQVTLEDVWRRFETPAEDEALLDHENIIPHSHVTRDTNSSASEHLHPSSRGFFMMQKSKPPSATRNFTDRRLVFGENRIPVRPLKTIFQLVWIALHDKIIILLSIAATVSLSLGLYQTFRPGSDNKLEWIEGVAILTAVTIVIVAQSINDYQKERQFAKLNHKKEDRQVKVIRGGRTVLISVYDILVGDLLHIEAGDIVPVDAILVEGQDVSCDESSATGESRTIRKVSAKTALENEDLAAGDIKNCDPFILSGAKVLEGVGNCLVTAVGTNSCYGRMMSSFQDEPEDTPLQIRLNRIADMIAKWGSGIAFLLFVILLIMFIVRLPGSNLSPSQKGEHFIQILIVSVSIVVVAVPEGLPLAVTLALAYATIRMIKDNNLVRVLRACETVGNATVICSDKTGTLTENKMTVVAGTLGTSNKFYRDLESNTAQSTVSYVTPEAANIQQFFGSLPQAVREMLRDGIALNSTAFESVDDKGNKVFIGSKTETALLEMARDYLGLDDLATERENAKPRQVQLFPFSSERKCMGVVLERKVAGQTVHRLFLKGASELVLNHSDRVMDSLGEQRLLSPQQRQTVAATIEDYASHSLRTIALAYRDFPPVHLPRKFEDVFDDMVFIGVVGIRDPLRPGVTKAVADCRGAGVRVIMVTGDNISTAKAVALECGIYSAADGIIMEGPEFRKLSRAQKDEIIPKLQVLARSSPEDKRMLVKRLKRLRHIVAVTGDGTNDAPALHAADVGFSMGIAGTEVAKAASAIILMDDNFASIVRAIAWGRCVNDAVKKFLQLTVSVTAVGFTFVSSVSSQDETSALTAVQLLWVNLIQDTLAALALATDPPTLALLDRPPEPKGSSLISFNMWKMIFGQSIVQLAIVFFLAFGGKGLFSSWDDLTLKTMVFNTFVWLQICNEINCRRLDNNLNVFSGIQRNPYFIVILVIMVACQTLIIFVGGPAFSVTTLNSQQWLICMGLGMLALPAGAIVRLIPNDFLRMFIPARLLRPNFHIGDVEDREIEDWDDALEVITDDLLTFKRLRGKGRLGNLGSHNHHVGSDPQSLASTRRSSTDEAAQEIQQPGRSYDSRLYSLHSSTTLVPGLVALSLALPPVTRAPQPPAAGTQNEERIFPRADSDLPNGTTQT